MLEHMNHLRLFSLTMTSKTDVISKLGNSFLHEKFFFFFLGLLLRAEQKKIFFSPMEIMEGKKINQDIKKKNKKKY